MILNQNARKYGHLIFDLDGTLVDTSPDIVAAVQYLIKKYGLPEKTDASIQSCIGGGARNVLLKSLGEERESLIDAEILPLFVAYYTSNCAVHSRLYEGVREILEQYREAGKKLSVATFKIRSATMNIFERFALTPYFDVIITADDVKNPKPAPDCIDAIINHYGAEKADFILIGDTRTDYLTATNAGIDVCGVTYGYNSPELMISLKPAYVIDRMAELPSVVW
ncbi:HAD family hydrolase [Acetobacterium malicum]|uniref:HAD family hydrolase n=1 Tax=Acetobacterium malicum TaxID=52692 RepID=UPI00040FDB49|nr:HAD hydrolase-like protein [Acetobacterium dehalogenans]